MNIWDQANLFLFNIKVGEGYKTSLDTEVVCTKRTAKRIHLSNGVIVNIKDSGKFIYLSSASKTVGYRRYEKVQQVLRDIEGYLIYLIYHN